MIRTAVRLLLLLGWRLHVEGRARVPPGPVIVVANHESLLDPLVLGCALPRPARFLAKLDLFRGPLGVVLRVLGAIPVARGRGDRGAVEAGIAALAAGDAVALFPQGTVLGPPDRPWLRGAARLALATGAPVLPVHLNGTAKALRPGSRMPRLTRLQVTIGEPVIVTPAPVSIAAARELTERLREAVDALRPA